MTLSNPTVPDVVLQYTTFKQITDDISGARVYGGTHSNRSGRRRAPGKRYRQGRVQELLTSHAR
jgi:hypothetical protein